MIRWLRNRWHATQRAIDLAILWPACCRARTEGQTIDHCKSAFELHAFNDRAWLSLGEARIYEIIDGLEDTK